jgi:AAA15 family ATPase/GTPase
VAAIYGGNASGKTNFFKAIAFLKRLVVSESKANDLVNLEQFRLGSDIKRPTSFCINLMIDNSIFEFSVTVTEEEVIDEKLTELGTSVDRVLYHRHDGSITFEKSLSKDQFLQFAYKGTSKSQLFIANCASQNIENFLPVYNWFKNSLVLVSPDSKFVSFEKLIDQNSHFQVVINSALAGLDTGIRQLALEEVSLDSLDLSDAERREISLVVSDTQLLGVVSDGDIVLFSREDGRFMGKKFVTYHRQRDGSDARFEIRSESDGTRRIIDLLPAFLAISSKNSKQVMIVDELDRSLHTLLTRRMLAEYLSSCDSQSRSQLLFSTHDVLLMDQKLLRRDEMWVTERDADGATHLISFNDYKDIRYDKDIRKSYLAGRMGGIPRLLVGELLPTDIEEAVN